MTVLAAILLLVIIMDPIGNVPVFLSILKNIPIERRRKVLIRELLIALIVLLFFMFIGRYILQLLQIAESSLGIAGGIMLFIIAINMIFPGNKNMFAHNEKMEPLVVPLAVPMIAGPSAIAAVILMMAQEPDRWKEWVFALIIAWLIAGVTLLSSETLGRKLGERALLAIERLMGILLMLVSVDLIIDGIKQTFNI
ncbi:MAG TPA: MarC family protein [Gammaproteobacteria bacterium]|nr:MarC family protein [Gammaproteobacteria bacterium]